MRPCLSLEQSTLNLHEPRAPSLLDLGRDCSKPLLVLRWPVLRFLHALQRHLGPVRLADCNTSCHIQQKCTHKQEGKPARRKDTSRPSEQILQDQGSERHQRRAVFWLQCTVGLQSDRENLERGKAQDDKKPVKRQRNQAVHLLSRVGMPLMRVVTPTSFCSLPGRYMCT